jgi:hypothetical protein
MTLKKAHRQTFKRVGIYPQRLFFPHGHLYATFSRASWFDANTVSREVLWSFKYLKKFLLTKYFIFSTCELSAEVQLVTTSLYTITNVFRSADQRGTHKSTVRQVGHDTDQWQSLAWFLTNHNHTAPIKSTLVQSRNNASRFQLQVCAVLINQGFLDSQLTRGYFIPECDCLISTPVQVHAQFHASACNRTYLVVQAVGVVTILAELSQLRSEDLTLNLSVSLHDT